MVLTVILAHSACRPPVKFLEECYPFYLKTKKISLDNKLVEPANDRVNVPNEKQSKWRTIFHIDNLELKPNFAGIGINLNEIINRWKKGT